MNILEACSTTARHCVGSADREGGAKEQRETFSLAVKYRGAVHGYDTRYKLEGGMQTKSYGNE